MKIFVKGFGNSHFSIANLSIDDKVVTLKERICERTGNTVEDLFVVFEGKVLDKDKHDMTLGSLNFQNNQTLTIISRLKGGS